MWQADQAPLCVAGSKHRMRMDRLALFKGEGRVRVRYRITLKQVSEPLTFILSPAEGRGDRNADALLCV